MSSKEEQLSKDIDTLNDSVNGLLLRISDDIDSVLKEARKLDLEEVAYMMIADSIGIKDLDSEKLKELLK